MIIGVFGADRAFVSLIAWLFKVILTDRIKIISKKCVYNFCYENQIKSFLLVYGAVKTTESSVKVIDKRCIIHLYELELSTDVLKSAYFLVSFYLDFTYLSDFIYLFHYHHWQFGS